MSNSSDDYEPTGTIYDWGKKTKKTSRTKGEELIPWYKKSISVTAAWIIFIISFFTIPVVSLIFLAVAIGLSIQAGIDKRKKNG